MVFMKVKTPLPNRHYNLYSKRVAVWVYNENTDIPRFMDLKLKESTLISISSRLSTAIPNREVQGFTGKIPIMKTGTL